MRTDVLLYVCLLAAGMAGAQEEVTQPLDPQAAGAVDVTARLGGLSSLPAQPEDGYWIDNAPINEVFQYLARSAGLQYFFNNELNTPEYNITGHLRLEDPRQQMEDLAVYHGLTVYQQRSAVNLMTVQQLSRLPVEVMSYQLKYLRGAPLNRNAGGGASDEGGGAVVTDFEKLKSIIRPMLTPVVGQIEFEEKTNTLLITDNSLKLERIRGLLTEIDKAKQQIMVNVRVLRIRRNQGRNVGVDWSTALGDSGTTVTIRQSLNALFNLPDLSTVTSSGDPQNPGRVLDQVNTQGAGVVFDNFQVQAILRALEAADLVTQEACPTIITEDNEQGLISIVDRFPIITSDITNTTAGTNVTDKVRYKIDVEDPSATQEPEKNREIGVTLSVTPTLLPDGTVRMKLRPRVAKIVELIPGRTSNVFPRVSESTVEAISRIPAGQSLFLGGFYDYSDTEGNNKVPILGTIPLVGRLFSSDMKKLEQLSLVFVITPSVYDASNPGAIEEINWKVKSYSGMQPEDLGGDYGLLPKPGWPNATENSKSLGNETGLNSSGLAPKESWVKRVFGRRTGRGP